MKNKKAEALESNGEKTNLESELTMKSIQTENQSMKSIQNVESFSIENHNTPRKKFQYHCSFCACELSNDSVRFNGVGACPACDDLAHLWVKSLRQYAANYANNLGVRK